LYTLIADLRHALRMFRKAPLWTLAVIATLALGIGAASAMFTIGNAVLIRPLPYPRPDRIVVLAGANPQKGIDRDRVTLADFR
jgi:putative ABC transport system permease protein